MRSFVYKLVKCERNQTERRLNRTLLKCVGRVRQGQQKSCKKQKKTSRKRSYNYTVK